MAPDAMARRVRELHAADRAGVVGPDGELKDHTHGQFRRRLSRLARRPVRRDRPAARPHPGRPWRSPHDDVHVLTPLDEPPVVARVQEALSRFSGVSQALLASRALLQRVDRKYTLAARDVEPVLARLCGTLRRAPGRQRPRRPLSHDLLRHGGSAPLPRASPWSCRALQGPRPSSRGSRNVLCRGQAPKRAGPFDQVGAAAAVRSLDARRRGATLHRASLPDCRRAS